LQLGCAQLLEYRNYRTLSWSPAPRLNVVTGLNAQGKTNLLEALGFLVTGRSFRTSRMAEIPRWGAETTLLTGELVRGDTRRTVRRTLSKTENGLWQQSVADPSPEWARVIAFGWQDLEIVNGAPAARRNFIDGFAGRLYANHIPTLLRFRQVLARRNRLLQQRPHDDGLAARLAPWTEQFVTVALELVDRRRKAVAALQTELARVHAALSGTRSKVEIRYRSALGQAAEPAALQAALDRHHREELRRGQTLVGPHRDDLAIELDGVDARAFGSRGQQRLIALALRLAEVLPVTEAAGTTPILLLDDALSELDPIVREHVLREIQAAEQVFLTTPEAPSLPGATIVQIDGGSLSAA
jgi:DNA replication and repair protein RecF